MKKLGYHLTAFHDVWHLNIFSRSVENVKFSLKPDKTNWHCTLHEISDVHWWSYLAQSFLGWEMLLTKLVKKIKTHLIFNKFHFFFSKIMPFMRQCGKTMLSWTGHRWQYGTCALHAGYLRLQRHSAYEILNTFPLQQLLHGNTSVLSDTILPILFKFIFVTPKKKIKISIYFSWYRCRFLVQFRRFSIPTQPVLNCSFRPSVLQFVCDRSRKAERNIMKCNIKELYRNMWSTFSFL